MDGKKEVIPAKLEKNVSFDKEIQVPTDKTLHINKEDKAIVLIDGKSNMEIRIVEPPEYETVETLSIAFKRVMSLSEAGEEIPVKEMDLN